MKVSRLDKAVKEFAAIRSLRDLVADAQLAHDAVFREESRLGRWGALLYVHKGTNRPVEAATPLAFREVIYKTDFAAGDLSDVLDRVFNELENAHRGRLLKVSVQKHFQRYLRHHAARGRIKCILGPEADANEFDFLGARIVNPLKFLETLPRYARLYVGRVHGDLHPDNIILDRNGVPHLIDFAWAQKPRDVLVDFVLLETSIRFMLFPRPINLADQLTVDRLLLEEDGTGGVKGLRFCTPESQWAYTRLASAVTEIRTRARRVLGRHFLMERYLLTQFLLLYGLLGYNDYEPYTGTRALGLIGAHLRMTGLTFGSNV
jgi:hypothetical protein